MSKASKFVIIFPTALLALGLYVLLHETGNLIVMLYAGTQITDFSVLTAHVSAAAAVLCGIGVFLLIRKGIAANYFTILKNENDKKNNS